MWLALAVPHAAADERPAVPLYTNDDLERVRFYRNSDVLRWCRTAELAISADDGKPDSEIEKILDDAEKEVQLFKSIAAKLQAARDKRFEKRAAIKNVAKLWHDASDAFMVMKPGIMGLHRAVAVRPECGRDVVPGGPVEPQACDEQDVHDQFSFSVRRHVTLEPIPDVPLPVRGALA